MTANDKDGGKREKITVTLPISDTIPGPGNYTVEVLNMNGPAMPVIDATDLIDSFGAGTTKDISSTEQAPELFGEVSILTDQQEQDENT